MFLALKNCLAALFLTSTEQSILQSYKLSVGKGG